jgi:hypothetical protein
VENKSERFYWWAVPSEYAKSCPDICEKYPFLLKELLNFVPKTAAATNYSIIPHNELITLIQNSNLNVSDIISVPLSIIPGEINHSSISTKIIDRPFGTLQIHRDLNDSNLKVTFNLKSRFSIPKCTNKELCFPKIDSKDSKSTPSKRQLIDFSKFPSLKTDTNLFIARVPNELNSTHVEIIYWLNSAKSIWAAGIKTFKRLSALGVKVTGTVDSLGQQELNNQLIENLFGNRWLKLTFSTDYLDTDKNAFAWYHIDFAEFDKSILNNTHFFWMSRTNYMFALSQFPELKNKYHSSGLGSSFDFFSTNLTADNYQPFYSIDDWRKSILQ